MIEIDKNAPIYIAVSGGGFHTHTAMSAWISGLLRHSELGTVEQIFENVRGISANSGGSWFVSHLAYSNAFVNALVEDSQSEKSTWSSSGYLGQMGKSFFPGATEANLTEEKSSWIEDISFLRTYAKVFFQVRWRWHEFVTTKVYEPLEKLGNGEDNLETCKGKKLSNINDRLPWFRDKDFVIASALLNSTVVIQATGGLWSTNQLYSVNPDDGSKPLSNVIPMCLSGVPEGRKATTLFMSGSQRLEYRQYDMRKNKPAEIQLTADYPQNVSLLDATIASSSAFAISASEASMGKMYPNRNGGNSLSWACFYAADLAPPIKFATDGIDILKTIGRGTYHEFAEQKIARVADGGFVDNSSVAFQLRHMNENGDLKDGFHVVLFMNGSYEGVTYHGHVMNVGIATLFGHDGLTDDERAKRATTGQTNQLGEGNVWFNFFGDGFIEVPSVHVFDAEPWKTNATKPIWSWKDKDEKISLQAYKIAVTTIENKVFGIPAGVRGTMYIFEVTQPESFAIPKTENGLGTYKFLFETIRNEVCKNNEALFYLKEALGLN